MTAEICSSLQTGWKCRRRFGVVEELDRQVNHLGHSGEAIEVRTPWVCGREGSDKTRCSVPCLGGPSIGEGGDISSQSLGKADPSENERRFEELGTNGLLFRDCQVCFRTSFG